MKIPKAKKTKSGKYRVQLLADGERISITRDTEADAIADAMAFKSRHQIVEHNIHITLKDAYTGYIETCEKALSPSTIAGYKRLARNTFQDIMCKKLSQLNNQMIQKCVNDMIDADYSPKYISNAHGLLSAVLKKYRPQLILNTKLPKKRKVKKRRLTQEDIKKILEACQGTEMEIPILMGLWLGMRMSEILGAEYGDIDGNLLHICRAVVVDEHYKEVEKPPKTFNGDRYVNIPTYLLNLLDGKDGRIVNMSGQAIYKRFSRLCEKSGIEHCRFHDLRCANAAIMIKLGIDSKYAQERNGWKTDSMYRQVYGYTFDEKMEEVNESINEYFEKLHTNCT